MLASLYSRDFIEIPMSENNLKVLTLNVIESCDARCLYCHWWRMKGTAEPFNVLVDAVDQAASIGAIAVRISGGEPILHPDLPALISHLREGGLVSMVCTAAKCKSHSLFALIDAGLDILSVSIDTLKAELFHRIRGYDLEPVLENLDRLIKYRAQSNFEIVLSVVVSRLSMNSLNDLLRYARSRDMVVSITPFQDATPEHWSPMSALVFRKDEDTHLRRAMCLIQEAAVSGVRVINSDEYLDGVADFFIARQLPKGYVCRAGDHAAVRLVGGGLKLCHSISGILGADLAAAWSSDDADALRMRMARLECPGCWLSCHADKRRQVDHHYGRPEIWEAL